MRFSGKQTVTPWEGHLSKVPFPDHPTGINAFFNR